MASVRFLDEPASTEPRIRWLDEPAPEARIRWLDGPDGEPAAPSRTVLAEAPVRPLSGRERYSRPLPGAPTAEPAAASVEFPDQPGALSRGFVSGMLEQNPEMLGETFEGLAYLAPDQLSQSLVSGSFDMKELAKLSPEEYRTRAKSMFESGSLDEALTWAGETLGQGLASTVGPLIGGTAGAFVGSRLGGKVATTAGATVGAGIPSSALNYGELYRALKDEGVEPKLAAEYAIYGTGPITALDVASLGPIVTRLGLAQVRGQIVRGVAKRLAVEAGKGAGREGLTEAAQEALKEATVSLATGQPFATAENLAQIAEAGAGGALTGGALGGAGGIMPDRAGAQPVVPAKPVGEIAKAEAAPPLVTPEDVASPLPTELIAEGRQVMAGAEGASRADDILTRNGMPATGSPVTVTWPDGRTQTGTVADAFREDNAELGITVEGVKIALDGGATLEEFFPTLAQAGVKVTAAPLTDATRETISAPEPVESPLAPVLGETTAATVETSEGPMPSGALTPAVLGTAPVAAPLAQPPAEPAGALPAAPLQAPSPAPLATPAPAAAAPPPALDTVGLTPVAQEAPRDQEGRLEVRRPLGEGQEAVQADEQGRGEEAAGTGRIFQEEGQRAPGGIGAALQSRLALPAEVSFGPGGRLKTTPVDRPTYRETDARGLDGLLIDNMGGGMTQAYVADNPDLALGQGENRGVRVTFRAGAVSATERRKPGTGDIAGREYVTDYIAADAIDRVEIDKGVLLPKRTRVRLARDFTREALPDGSQVFTRKGVALPPPVPAPQRALKAKVAAKERPPVDALAFLARLGGIRDDEGHDLKRGRNLQKFIPGAGALIRSTGMDVDSAGEALHEAGYFGPPATTPRPSVAEVLDLLDAARRGTRLTAEAQASAEETAAGTVAERENERAREDVKAIARDMGEILSVSEIDAIVAVMGREGIDAEAAVVEHVERLALQAADALSSGTGDPTYDDIPFGPAEDGGAAREGQPGQPREPADAGEGRPGGEAAAQGRSETGEPQGEVAPLYANRPVSNAADIIAWARAQGFTSTLPASDMHVTVAFSKEPVAWSAAGADAPMVRAEGGKRVVEQLGDKGAVVLRFESGALSQRWQQYRDAGASWDFQGYKPHITITYEPGGIDLSKVEPYAGPILLGAEEQEPINEDASDDVKEAPTGATEQTPEGTQTVIPGAERISDRSLAERRMEAPKRAAVAQKDADEGLFDVEGRKQTDLMDVLVQPAARPATTAARAPAPAAPGRIEDFGETLEGARKHYAQAYRDRMKEAADADVSAVPLSKSWPEPDYQKLLDDGTDPWIVAFIHAARDEIPAKPSRPWRLKGWVESVTTMRGFSGRLLDGSISKADVLGHLDRKEFARLKRDIGGRIELYQAVGHEKSLKGVRLREAIYSMYRGVEYKPARIIWTIERETKATAFGNWPRELASGDTREAAIAAFKASIGSIDIDPKAEKQVKFDIYSRSGQDGYIVGKKIGTNAIDLKRFDTVKEARAYIAEHHDDLVRMLERRKDIPDHRRETDSPRVGVDHRSGADVTPQAFGETFGFRGVQFGNYVEGPRRQQDLNQAYDGLMDLAGLLGIPPKALSLNGQLGLAFGARGTGGKRPAKAHYEPGTVVINLTKNAGAGSLAHEWWHALDNYFSRGRGQKDEFSTEALDVLLASRGSPFVEPTGIRKEMVAAFGAVMRAVNQTSLRERSRRLDNRRAKAYWSTGREMTARSFESYIIARLQDQGASNDYLANIVSEDFWNAAEALGIGEGGGLEQTYPYLTAGEIQPIRAAFDEFFDTVQTRETERGVEMLSLRAGQGQAGPAGDPAALEADLRARLEQIGIADKVVLEVVEAIRSAVTGQLTPAEGRYSNGLIEVALSAGDKPFVLNHESVHALRDLGLIKDAEWRTLERAALADTERMAEIRERYAEQNLTEAELVEEAVADMFADWSAGRSEQKGFIRIAFERIRDFLDALGNALRGAGFQTADDVFERVESGEVGAREAIDETGPMGLSERFMVAWHGGPHDFDQFTTEKIGTGEGAQAFGWGLYFAGKREVAEHYRSKLSGAPVTYKGLLGRRAFNPFADLESPQASLYVKEQDYDIPSTISRLETKRSEMAQARGFADRIATIDRDIKLLRKIEKTGGFTKAGRLYQVDLAPAEDEYMLWDRPLSEQSETVKAALDRLPPPAGKEAYRSFGEWIGGEVQTGRQAYEELARGFREGWMASAGIGGRNGQRAASEALRAAGIPGIKYLDGGSRTAGDGTYNYVLFDDSLVTITEKYSLPKRPARPADAADTATFENGESERRWQDARKGAAGQETLVARTSAWLETIANGFTRHFIALPNTARFSDVREQLRKLEAAPQASKEQVIRILRGLTKGMTPADLDLFTRKVVLDDLSWEAGQDRDLPFGMSAEDVAREKAKVDAIMDRRPDLSAAVRQRKLVVRQVANDLVSSGVLHREQIRNPAYYRHQVLDYARAQVAYAKGAGQKLRSPHWARRMGSTLDINANLLEAEFDWLHKAFTDVATAKTIAWIKRSSHNVRQDVIDKAKASNAKLVQEALAREAGPEAFALTEGGGAGPLNDAWRGFRQKIAAGLAKVRKAIEDGDLHVPEEFEAAADKLTGEAENDASLFPFLAWIMDNDEAGAMGAAQAFKAVSQRRAWTKDLLGDRYADTMNVGSLVKRFAPEGYVAWQPDEGKLLFTAKSLPEHVIDRMIARVAEDGVGTITVDELRGAMESVRSMLAVGGNKFELVIPEELAQTLNSLRDEHVNALVNFVLERPMRMWKRWVLINPRRVVKYNLNNLSGDLDAVIAGNPKALRSMGRAIKELYAVMRRGEAPSDRYREAVERGVFDSGLSIQEIPDINVLSEFESLMEKPPIYRVDRFALSGFMKAWRLLQGYTQFRENWLRYAAYLDYVERIEGGEPMSSIGYGAALPAMVDAIADPKDRAALLARELVGDYGAVSHIGQDIRRRYIPFWSWMEINAKRYWRLTSNAYGQGVGKGLATSGVIGAGLGLRTTVWLALRMAMFYGLVQVWNNLFFGDDEDDLDPEERARLHLLLGRDEDGNVRSLRIQGAFGDALAWFGFEDVLNAVSEIEKGRAGFVDVLEAIVRAPVNKIVGGFTPVIKAPVEALVGLSLWPDAFRAMPVKDGWRNLFRTFSLEHEYDLVFDKPSRGYGESFAQAVLYSRDPGENAYQRIKGLSYDWLHREKGTEGTSTFSTPRSEALYEWRLAKKYGDAEAEDAARERLRELGVKGDDLRASIKRAHPLGAVAIKDRAAFLRTLSSDEREQLDQAIDWYRDTFLD